MKKTAFKFLGQSAYEGYAYYKHSSTGQILPSWENLDTEEQNSWLAAACSLGNAWDDTAEELNLTGFKYRGK